MVPIKSSGATKLLICRNSVFAVSTSLLFNKISCLAKIIAKQKSVIQYAMPRPAEIPASINIENEKIKRMTDITRALFMPRRLIKKFLFFLSFCVSYMACDIPKPVVQKRIDAPKMNGINSSLLLAAIKPPIGHKASKN